jgi:addiction module HigA family antidote
MTNAIPPLPGEALRDLLDERGISQSRAALALGLSRGHLNSIINGHNPISAELKLKLQDFLNVPTQHWTRLQDQQDVFAATPDGRKHLQDVRRQHFLDELQLSPHERLSRLHLHEAVASGWLGLEPFSSSQLTRAGCWLTLGLRGLVTRLKDPAKRPQEAEVLLKPALELSPGDVLSVLTHEKITLPDELEMRVNTASDAFCTAELALHCRLHFESGLAAPISLQIVNQSGRPQTVRFLQQAIHVQFEFSPDPTLGSPP